MAPLIYVINLERDAERLETIRQNLATQGLTFVRIPAVLGKDLANWEGFIDLPLYNKRNRRTTPRLGEIGCYLSHLKAMETFLQTAEPWCLILEDDAEIRPALGSVLAELTSQDDWDMVKLFYFHSGLPMRKRALGPQHHLVVHLTRTTSTAAYIVNRHAASTLVKSLLPLSEQIDHAHDRPWETGLRTRGVYPQPITLAPTSLTTTIGYTDKSDERLPLGRALQLFLARSGKEIRRLAHGLVQGIRR